MLIERILLRGFRSYEDQELDLSGVSAAVVAGPTGSGKSAFFVDGPLWILYGRTRSKGGDGYVRVGADEVHGEIDLRFGGDLYRVVRHRSFKTKRGKGELDLFVAADFGRAWEPLTGKTIPETEAAIAKLIGRDFDTLVSSVVSPQGESDRFTAPPRITIDGIAYEGGRARIQVLAQSLGLGRFEGYRTTAREAARALAVTVEARDLAVTNARKQLEEEPQALIDHAAALARLSDVQQAAAQANERRVAADERVTQAAAEVERHRGLAGRADEAEARHGSIAAQLDATTQRLGRLEEIAANGAEIRAKAAEATRVAASLEDGRAALADLDRRIGAAAKGVARITKAVADDRARLLQERGDLRSKLERERAAVSARAVALETSLVDARLRAGLMGTVPCLSHADMQRTCQLLQSAREAAEAVPGIMADLEGIRLWVPDPDRLDRLAKIEDALGGLPAVTEVVEAALKRVEGDRPAAAALVQALEVAHQVLARFVALVPSLDLAESEVPRLRDETVALEQQRRDAHAEVLAGQAARAELRAVEERFVQARNAALECRSHSESLARDEAKAIAAVESATARLRLLESIAAEAAAAAADVEAGRAELRLLDALQQAYRQIPVMMIETGAAPFLEAEANRILAAVSGSGMRVELRTQRALKESERVVDALDIAVTDAVGERALEDFSGGQRFLVDLALRLALAKLQGHRGATRLETLILDEGFGSLDPATLSQVQKVLRGAQDAFPRLLVISHVAEMRDLFPVAIAVAGGPQRSHLEVLRA